VDNFLVSTVKDTGIGMSNVDLTQLFKFFGQISKSKDINRGGMGLGLTISKMILQ
jgi:signal transduction histidine kinase